jgi:hypothetical protein
LGEKYCVEIDEGDYELLGDLLAFALKLCLHDTTGQLQRLFFALFFVLAHQLAPEELGQYHSFRILFSPLNITFQTETTSFSGIPQFSFIKTLP